MGEIDKKLRVILFSRYYNAVGFTHLDIAELEKNKRDKYTSGRKIKFNDIVIYLTLSTYPNKKTINREIITLNVNEIDNFSEKHRLIYINDLAIFCIKHNLGFPHHADSWFHSSTNNFSVICRKEDISIAIESEKSLKENVLMIIKAEKKKLKKQRYLRCY